MAGSCGVCGAGMAAGADRCPSCGHVQIADTGSTYGNLDLGPPTGVQAVPLAAEAPLTESGERRRQSGERRRPRATSGALDGRRTQPRAPRKSTPRATAGTPQGVGAMPSGGGAMLDADPLNANFDATAPALELDVEDPRAAAAAEAEQQLRENQRRREAEKKESPAEIRARQVRELANYGPPPTQIWQSIGYCVRVMMRKKELSEQLTALSAQRKRAEDDAQEVLGKMGHKLYELRQDPRMRGLTAQLKVIADSASKVGDVAALGAQKQKSMAKEISGLSQQLDAEEALAKPLRDKEAVLAGQLEEMKARVQQATTLLKKLDGELTAVRAGKMKVDAERFGLMQAERDARHGELQTLGVQMRPLEDQLSVVRNELSKHLRKISTLQGEQAQASSAMQRAEQQQRLSSGSAESHYREALVTLARAALERNLAGLVPEHAGDAADGVIRADKKRKEEDLYRAAANSYDTEMYKKGNTILLGGSAILFFGFAIMVLF